ncbi:MAG: hypothetical protein HXY20_01500 [Acidobacteria bacterium]|nr:hypothetical protein [Acidobacteriota bacterium]
MLHDKHSSAWFVLDRGDTIQPCQGGFHIARSTPFTQHAVHLDEGSLSVIVEYARLGIDAQVHE